jgi:hypothetical protein
MTKPTAPSAKTRIISPNLLCAGGHEADKCPERKDSTLKLPQRTSISRHNVKGNGTHVPVDV